MADDRTPARRKPRKTRAQREAEAAKRAEAELAEAQERAITWATNHGAPLLILDGWNPETGEWSSTSPIGRLLTFVGNGNFLTVAANLAGIPRVGQLYARGAEYAAEAPEDRNLIDIEYRVFVDLHRAIDIAESFVEVDLVAEIRKAAKRDPDLALKFLARRFPVRWKEQHGFMFSEDHDEGDAVIANAIQDPNVAMHLAAVAEQIERDRPEESIG